MFNWFRKSADTDTHQIQPADPAQPTVKEMDSVAAAFEKDATRWKEAALKADAGRIKALAERNAARDELARLKASRERSNANLRRGSKRKSDEMAEFILRAGA